MHPNSSTFFLRAIQVLQTSIKPRIFQKIKESSGVYDCILHFESISALITSDILFFPFKNTGHGHPHEEQK